MLRAVSRLDKPSAMRGVLLLLLLVIHLPAAIAKPKHRDDKADKPAPAAAPAPEAASTPPGPDDAKATQLLDKIAAGPDAAARKAAITQLGAIAPHTVEAIGTWLVRAHQTEVGDRRSVLAAIKASVPDKTGKFTTPARQTGKEQQADDEIDWLTSLLADGVSDNAAALGEVIADDAAIRALAATNDLRAAQRIFDAGFTDATMIYRDECGRYLRKMEPASIPALMTESQGKDADRKRYATWQLERLDRQEPNKALDAALGDEALTLAILEVFRTTHHREAVHAVWKRVDADTPRVRAAARAAWMDYITGPPPPPAPMAKLNLPGGKKTKKAKPLWLTYRELADNELRKAANELLHEDYPIDDPSLEDTEREKKPVKIDLEDVTKRLFAYYDAERGKKEATQWTAAQQKSASGDLAGAALAVDQMLATNPDRPEKVDMAKLYLAFGKQLESKQKWAEAAAAFSKAHGLDPKGASANEALAAHYYTLGKSLEAQGKDGGPDLRRAIALKPDYAPAKADPATSSAEATAAAAGRPLWMLYAAAGVGVAAMLLFAAAMMRRRA